MMPAVDLGGLQQTTSSCAVLNMQTSAVGYNPSASTVNAGAYTPGTYLVEVTYQAECALPLTTTGYVIALSVQVTDDTGLLSSVTGANALGGGYQIYNVTLLSTDAPATYSPAYWSMASSTSDGTSQVSTPGIHCNLVTADAHSNQSVLPRKFAFAFSPAKATNLRVTFTTESNLLNLPIMVISTFAASQLS